MTDDAAGPAPAWERVKEVLADALDLPPEERAAFLDDACAGEPALRAEVARLLPADERASRFLARPATELFDAPTLAPGERIGHYELRGVLGEGGMGRVYEAVQERPHRTVALKVLRPGFLSAGAEQRFEWEVEALGRLAHPAIARVLEAGIDVTERGARVSWFAMEKIDGRPLFEAADALALDRAARLRLFLRVCAGVSHAHQRGIIHRDLKPENVLVDAAGDPHIVDFGIARAADPLASSVTSAGEVVGTLAYMSPEQVLGDPERVDVRTDVYALGVLLYRLLTGHAPLDFDGLSLPAIARRLTEDDPRPASRFDRALRGDLETVLATALARDVERRYASVDGLAGDVLAALEDRPIAARPPTALYHFTKFAQRHRGLVASVAASFVLLVVAVAGTTLGMRRAEEASARADESREQERLAKVDAQGALTRANIERDRAQATSAFLRRIFASADPRELGVDVRVVDVLHSAGRDLAADTTLEDAVRGALHLSLGDTYRRLDVYDEALEHLTRAVTLLAATEGPRADQVLDARAARAEVLTNLLRFDEARAEAQRLTEAVDTLRREVSVKEREAWVWMRPLEIDQYILEGEGESERAQALGKQILDGWLALGEPGQDAVEAARNGYGQSLLARGEYEPAIALFREGIEHAAAALGERHPTTLSLRLNLALALSEIGERSEAETRLRELVPLAREVWGARSRMALTAENNLASELANQSRFDEALALQERIVTLSDSVFGHDHPETLIARNNMAVSLAQLQRWSESLAQLDEVLAGFGRVEGYDDPALRARVQGTRAAVLGELDRGAEALPALREVLTAYADWLGPGAQQVLITRNNLAMLLLSLGHHAEALQAAEENLALAEEHQPGHPYNVFPFRMNLGRALVAAGRWSDGVSVLRDVVARLAADPEASDTERARAQEVLAEVEGRAEER